MLGLAAVKHAQNQVHRDTSYDVPSARDDTLGALLMAIADDAERRGGAMLDAIRGEFAIKMDDARRREPKHQLAGTLQRLAEARSSALAAAARNTATETHGRQQAVLTTRTRQAPAERPIDVDSWDNDRRAAPSPG